MSNKNNIEEQLAIIGEAIEFFIELKAAIQSGGIIELVNGDDGKIYVTTSYPFSYKSGGESFDLSAYFKNEKK